MRDGKELDIYVATLLPVREFIRENPELAKKHGIKTLLNAYIGSHIENRKLNRHWKATQKMRDKAWEQNEKLTRELFKMMEQRKSA